MRQEFIRMKKGLHAGKRRTRAQVKLLEEPGTYSNSYPITNRLKKKKDHLHEARNNQAQ
jgi:hypothetical protein